MIVFGKNNCFWFIQLEIFYWFYPCNVCNDDLQIKKTCVYGCFIIDFYYIPERFLAILWYRLKRKNLFWRLQLCIVVSHLQNKNFYNHVVYFKVRVCRILYNHQKWSKITYHTYPTYLVTHSKIQGEWRLQNVSTSNKPHHNEKLTWEALSVSLAFSKVTWLTGWVPIY